MTQTITTYKDLKPDGDRRASVRFHATRDAGACCEISEEMFDYYLDVLPPAFMPMPAWKDRFGGQHRAGASFGFAEGAELVVVFWRNSGKHYCQQSTTMNPWA